MRARRVIGCVLAAAMVVTLVPGDVQAKKKTPKLSVKKLSLPIGKTKKVTVKNAKKVKKLKWSVNKAGKKVVAIKKSGKKGFKVTAKKEGKATIQVRFKVAKKTYKNKLKVTVTKEAVEDAKPSEIPAISSTPTGAPTKATEKPTAMPTLEPTVAPTVEATTEPTIKPTIEPTVVPTAEPTQAPSGVVKTLDLFTFAVQSEEKGIPVYDEATGTIKAVDVEQFIVTLPQDVNTGETVKVTITGKNNGTVGFRFWLSDTFFGNLSENIKSTDLGIGAGEFEIVSELTSTGAATELLIKGPSYGTNMDDIEITGVKVEYSNVVHTYEPKNPYAPETEQKYDTTDLQLTKSFRERNQVSSEVVNSLLITQRFTADPTTIEYDGRLYVYGTTDEIEFDGKANVIANAYNTHTMTCISTDDMVNWKDEGKIDVTELTDYAQKSWAPSIVSKEMDGKTKFFLY